MKSKPSENIDNQSGGTAAKISYSPDELAEVFKTSRHDFYGINLAEATNNWSPTIIYSFLYELREPDNIKEAIEWLIISWEKSHHLYETYELAFDETLNSAYDTFKAFLHCTKDKLEERYKEEKREEELFTRRVGGYIPDTVTADLQEATSETDQTQEPSFGNSNGIMIPEYHISDLTEESQKILLIEDEAYSQLTDISRGEIWPWIKKKGLKYANVVRFVFRYLGFIPRKCSVLKFTNLFNEMVPEAKLKPDTVSSYGDANNDDFEAFEKLPKWKSLKKDSEAIIAMVKPVSDLHSAA